MSKVTLEYVAETLEGHCYCEPEQPECGFCVQAALVRAADEVVKAAWEQVRHPHNPRSLDALGKALATFNKISNGEQP